MIDDYHDLYLTPYTTFAAIPRYFSRYPLAGMAEVAARYQVDLEDPAMLFVTFGGFVHTDAGGKVVATAAIASDGEDVYFEPPFPWRNEFTPLLQNALVNNIPTVKTTMCTSAHMYVEVRNFEGMRLAKPKIVVHEFPA